MTRLSTVVVIVITSFVSSSAALGRQGVQLAAVHVRIVDASGQDLGEADVETFRCQACGRDFARNFRRNSVSGIPFGIYRLRVRATGFWSADRDVRVFQPDVWAVVQLELGMSSSEGGLQTFSLSGSLKNLAPRSEPVWLRLMGLYSAVVGDTKASRSGDFALAGLPQGWYVLITIQGKEVLDSRPIEIPTSGPAEIDLRSAK